METARVDILYRPLRIAFAIHSTDLESFRQAVRLNSAFWGGRYNPIVVVDYANADDLVELFRPDCIQALGTRPETVSFAERYPHLPHPSFSGGLFSPRDQRGQGRATVLDVINLLTHRRDHADWQALIEHGVRIPSWDNADPLADALLAQFGGYPEPTEVGINYNDALDQSATPLTLQFGAQDAVPPEAIDHPSISSISRFGLEPHYSRRPGWNYPGWYAGHANNIEDLCNFWNLRACGIQMLFFDLHHPDRFSAIRQPYDAMLATQLSSRDELHSKPAIWSRVELGGQAQAAFGGGHTLCPLSPAIWNGMNVQPALMHFGTESSLGIIGGQPGSPRISFALKDKPYSDEPWFYFQNLVASISLIGGSRDSSSFVFTPPYLPELNDAFARSMHVKLSGLRTELGRVGLIVDTADHDLSLTALPVATLMKQVFELAGFKAKLSNGGLITRQLITRMGGLNGARAFKISGVRRLLKTFGPTSSFSKRDAINKIATRDPGGPEFSFEVHKQLYIEPRDYRTDLTPAMVFSHLVEKGLFRIGSDLRCPTCALNCKFAGNSDPLRGGFRVQ
jgi:hypothetical protein